MSWTQVKTYAVRWNNTTKRGRVNLWLDGGGDDPNRPDESLDQLDAATFTAMATILRSDPDHKIAFDKTTRELASGFDLP
jgi:hypothetical protein